MKKLIGILMLLVSLFAIQTKAQTRVLFGVTGAQAYDNSSVGVTAALEIPFLTRYELDLKDTFSPFESKVALGGGRANIAGAGGFVWLTENWGLTGRVEDSSYNVTKITKDADYAFGGLAYRGIVGGLPARFTFQYIRQFNNGITPSGVESSHLQGFDFGFSVRYGCFGFVCVRNSTDFSAGRVLTQGNPVCDGTFGVTGGNGPNGSCPRGSALGGGVQMTIALERRPRGRESDKF